MPITKREVCALLPALLPLLSDLKVFSAEDQSLSSGAFSFENAPMHVANNNAQVRLMFRGKLTNGEGVEVHQTILPPGGSPTPGTHYHPHSEMWLIREGGIELTVNDKKFHIGTRLGRLRSLQRRAWNSQRRTSSSSWTGRGTPDLAP